MIAKKIYLDENKKDVCLDAYLADSVPDYDYKRKAILVIPGGGYSRVCSDREGEPIAMAFIPYGYQAFVLHYSVGRKEVFPSQLIEASLAMKHIRDNAEEYNIDPDSVFAVGFSAGGHLTASLGTLWHLKEIYDAIDMPYGYNKPTGIMPIYPVISADADFGHLPSFYNLFGTDTPTQEQLDAASLERHVDERTSPAFLMHTSEDEIVPVENSLVFAKAMAKAGLKFELHIYPEGQHGIALSNPITSINVEGFQDKSVAKWVSAAAEWAERIVAENK